MLSMMLDEMISPTLVPRLWELGVDGTHVRDRGMLSSPDHAVWARANEESRAVVTANAGDFRKLAAQSDLHNGLVIIPNGGTRDMQLDYVKASIDWARAKNSVLPSFTNSVVEVADDMAVSVDDIGTATVVPISKPTEI